MPFDGGFLHKIKQELEPMIGARVDKIGQPNRDCVVIHLHNRGAGAPPGDPGRCGPTTALFGHPH